MRHPSAKQHAPKSMEIPTETQLNIAGPTLAQAIGTLCSCATYQDALLFGAVHVRETATVSDHVTRKRTRHVTVTVQRIVPIIESFYATATGHVDPGSLRDTIARCHSVVPRAAPAAAVPSPPPRGAASKRVAAAATSAAASDSGSEAWGRMYCLGWARLRPDPTTADSRAQCIVRCAIYPTLCVCTIYVRIYFILFVLFYLRALFYMISCIYYLCGSRPVQWSC